MSSKHRFQSQRLTGRLFIEQGRLCMVLAVDHETGLATVSQQIDGHRLLEERPVADLIGMIAANGKIILDGLSAKETESRAFERGDAWYFSSREGEQGPFDDEVTARSALKKHILSAQEEGRPGPGRKVDDDRHQPLVSDLTLQES